MGPLKNLSEKHILTITLIIALILSFLCIDQGHNWSDDFALYISQCKALLNGNIYELYHTNRFSMDNSYAHTGPYLYPLGFPILLLPVYLIFGLNLYIMKVYCLLFFVASLPLIYLIFKKLTPEKNIPLAITMLIGFNYHFLRFSDNVLSDLPFFFFSLLSIYSIQKHERTTVVKSFSLGCLLFFTYCIRDIGIILLPCLLFFQISLYQKKKLLTFKTSLIPYLVFILGSIILYYWTPSTDEKQFELFFDSSFDIVKNNLYYYWLLTGNYFVIFLGLPNIFKWIISAIITIVIIIGILKQTTRINYILIYVSLTLGLYFTWVSFQGMRFMFPLWPFLLFYMLVGIKVLLKQKTLINFTITIIIASNLIQSCSVSYYYWNQDSNKAQSKDMQRIYHFIRKNLPENSIIIFNKPRALRLFTDRNSVQKNIKEANYILIPTTTNLNNYLFQTPEYTLIKK
ncbi:MAG: phospholipid carrier-dependent glycosyltransferase [Saprospiraceae bacterium]|nr:phospholipid carrier-dependent glycosyltransferase [Saprospiraceae bacterium]